MFSFLFFSCSQKSHVHRLVWVSHFGSSFSWGLQTDSYLRHLLQRVLWKGFLKSGLDASVVTGSLESADSLHGISCSALRSSCSGLPLPMTQWHSVRVYRDFIFFTLLPHRYRIIELEGTLPFSSDVVVWWLVFLIWSLTTTVITALKNWDGPMAKEMEL